jgi:hypothetical protein
MVKRIGIITFHKSHNYGSILQSYAMLKLVNNITPNQEIEIIDFSNKKQKEMYALFANFDSIRHLFKNIIIILFYRQFKSRFDSFNSFINNNLKLSNKSLSKSEDLLEIKDQYNIYIAGSDQIWNIKCYDNDIAYFLPNIKLKKKIAYAPSIGGVNYFLQDNPTINFYREFIMDFNFISSREINGQLMLQKLTNRQVPLVLDPTLVIESRHWFELMTPREIKKDYVFFYGGIYHKDTYNSALRIANKLGLPLYVIDFKSYVFKFGFLKKIKVSRDGSPQNFLSLIYNAKYVITNSLHGTIFSTIFKKNFWFLTFKNSNSFDDRIDSLLNQLKIKDRKVYIEENIPLDLSKPIDYNDFNNSIEELIRESINFLRNAIYESK